MSDLLRREVHWRPAFDRRDPDPSKDYGIHGMELRFLLIGDEGAVQFLIFTNWHLPHVQRELENRPADLYKPHLTCGPMPADLGYHSPGPMYEGQSDFGPCEYLGGRNCYYDGSGMAAEAMFDTFVTDGEEAMWSRLAGYYAATFSTDEAVPA